MGKTTQTIALPAPAPGNQHTLTVHRYGAGRPKAYLHAALHADEWPGLLVLHHLIRLLDQAAAQDAIRGEVVVVPVANPVGLGQFLNGYWLGRYDFDTTGNFNRSFADLTEPVWEAVGSGLQADADANAELIRAALHQAVAALPRRREADALKATLMGLAIDADVVLDLHCDGEALLHLYASSRHRQTAAELGAQIGAPVVLLEDNPGGGAFDDFLARVWWRLQERAGKAFPIPLGCFAATVEYRGRADVYDDLASDDAARLFKFLQRRGVIAGAPGPLPSALGEPTPLEGTDVIDAPAAGIVAYRKALGDWVEEGEVVADLIDLTAADPATARTPMRSRTRGLLFARMAEKLVRPGQHVCKIAGTTPLAHRQPGKLLED
ncbi:MAG: succinylglutamate desuccinylase/aspartoacylase family protein [Gammaproteobacteria bacterium]